MNNEEEKKYFDEIIDSLIIIDKEGRIREVNQATLELLGYKRRGDLIMAPMGKVFKDFSLTGLRNKIPIREQELTYLGKEDKEISVSANITGRYKYPDDTIFIARDVTKLKELINELTRSREELKSSYAAIRDSKDDLVRTEKLAFTGRIAAGIAHEIRNPLTNVAMGVQALKGDIKPEDPRVKNVDIIIKNTERINYLITELLNCARPPKLKIRAYNIHKVIKDLLETTKDKTKSQKVKVIKKFTSRKITIKMDREYIKRALLNIVLNAIDAMPRGGALTISTEPKGVFFLVKFQDTGKGIAEKDVIKIFDPFFSSKPGGVGLGLTLCYGIIVSHGGTIEVESKPRKGATFTVSLPLPSS